MAGFGRTFHYGMFRHFRKFDFSNADMEIVLPFCSMGIVNVASVPQRSPFRYPGGKTWLIPRIREWLKGDRRPSLLVEPFAGGAIVGLTVAFEDLADRVLLVEIDPDVAAVWRTILNGNAKWLADEICNFSLTPDMVRRTLSRKAESIRELAFQTILRNRVQRGGIMAPGAGLMKQGENGRGLASRWYPQTLARRILAIAHIRRRISFEEGDGLDAVRVHAHTTGAAFFIDPPYTVAGRRLYSYREIDHEQLFQLAAGVRGDFLMTYDNADEIRRLAARRGFETGLIPMKSTHHAKMTELLIGRDLSWLRGRDTVALPSQQLLFQTGIA